MATSGNQAWEEKQVADTALPEVYNNHVEKEYNVVPKYDTAEKQAVTPDNYDGEAPPPASDKRVVTFSRKTLIICGVILILLIGGLVGGLVGGLMSKQSSSAAPQASSTASPTSPGVVSSSSGGATTTSDGGSSTTSSPPQPKTTAPGSLATSTAAPASYPSSLSTSNLVQNPEFEKGLQYWSDPQHCWQSTSDPSSESDGNISRIARVYDNDQDPGNPCSLTQTISTVGAGNFVLDFLWGTYWDNAADAAEKGGRIIVRAGGSSSPAVLINTTYSVPGRYDGFPVGSFEITTYEEDFIIDFSAWSGGSVWDIAKVQLTRS